MAKEFEDETEKIEEKEELGENEGEVEKEPKSYTALIVIIILSVLIVIGIVSIALIFILPGNIDIMGDNETDDVIKENKVHDMSEESGFEDKLKNCLEKEKESSDCSILFTDPNIENYCENISRDYYELNDKCFYRAAISRERENLCENIQDNELKNKCIEEIEIYIDFEDEDEI